MPHPRAFFITQPQFDAWAKCHEGVERPGACPSDGQRLAPVCPQLPAPISASSRFALASKRSIRA
jgi:hypothetical protein